MVIFNEGWVEKLPSLKQDGLQLVLQTHNPSLHHPSQLVFLLALTLHLSGCFDPLPDAEVHDCEDKQQAEGELPANPSQVIQPLGSVYLENVAAETERKQKLELTLDANSGQKKGPGCGMRTQNAVTRLVLRRTRHSQPSG